MSFISWLVVGLVAGFLASKLVNRRGAGVIMDIIIGAVGAVIGGWVFSYIGLAAPGGIDLYSIVVAFIGAVVVLVIFNALFQPRQRSRK